MEPNHEYLDKVLTLILEENKLSLKKIPEVLRNKKRISHFAQGRYSLMKALSDALYFTTTYFRCIQKQCVDYISNDPAAFVNHTLLDLYLPLEIQKIEGIQRKHLLIQGLLRNTPFRILPTSKLSQKFINRLTMSQINLDIASQLFDLNIRVYTLNVAEVTLSSYRINRRGKKLVMLLKTDENHFNTLYGSEQFESFGFCQNIVFNVSSHTMGMKANFSIVTQSDSEQFNRMEKFQPR